MTIAMSQLVFASICCDQLNGCLIIETCQDAACGVCDLSLYNETGMEVIHQEGMTQETLYTYSYNATYNLSNYGLYSYTINCSTNKTCMGDCAVEYKYDCEGINMGIIAMIIAIPLIIAGICLYLGKNLPGNHWPMRIFLNLFAFISLFVGYFYASVSLEKFYDFPELSAAMGTGLFSYGMIFYVIIAYWIIYAIVLIFKVAAQKKIKTGDYGNEED